MNPPSPNTNQGGLDRAVEAMAQRLYDQHVEAMEYHPRPRWEDETEGHRVTWRVIANGHLDAALSTGELVLRERLLAEADEYERVAGKLHREADDLDDRAFSEDAERFTLEAKGIRKALHTATKGEEQRFTWQHTVKQ